jgi:hypothetical protein
MRQAPAPGGRCRLFALPRIMRPRKLTSHRDRKISHARAMNRTFPDYAISTAALTCAPAGIAMRGSGAISGIDSAVHLMLQ